MTEADGPGPDGSHDPAFRWVTIRGVRYGMHNDIANEIERLRAALTGAVEVIKTWHNMGGAESVWPIYWRSAPEMKLIREALAGATEETEPRHTGIEFLQTWMRAENPMLGGVTPLAMLKAGRGEKLAKFIEEAHAANQTARASE